MKGGYGGGVGVITTGTEEEQKVNLRYLMRVFAYLRPYKRLIVLGFSASVYTKALQLLRPYFVGRAVDGFTVWGDLTIVYWSVVAIVVAACGEALSEFLWRITLPRTGFHLEIDIRNRFFAHILRLSHSWFDRTRTGDLMSRATSDIHTLRRVVQFGLVSVLRNGIMIIGALFMMLRVSPYLTLLALAPLIGLTVLVRLLGPLLHRRSMAVQEQIAEVSAKAQENFTGVRIVKAYGMEEAEKKRFSELSKDYYKKNMSLAKVSAFTHTGLMLIFEVGVLLILLVGGRSIIFGKLSYGQFVEFIGYQMMLIWPMISFGLIITMLQRGAASLLRIERVLNEEPQIKEPEDAVEMKSLKCDIIIKNLRFSYNGEPVLKDLNLTIEGGRVLGVTGPVGCGKTTLLLLLSRLYEVPEGTIFYGGVDVRRLPLRILHSRIAYAPQDPFLFSDTIAENIGFARPDATEREIRRYAEIAGLTDEIESFPQRYEQIIGERGITLSGGQKQRISLARALITEPDILILDDALSSVDAQKEDEIMSKLKDYFRGRTVILVSHRVSTLKYADRIVVLADGRVVEEGTHTELIRKDGLYRRIYERQRVSEHIGVEK